jgi:hypothetical protein
MIVDLSAAENRKSDSEFGRSVSFRGHFPRLRDCKEQFITALDQCWRSITWMRNWDILLALHWKLLKGRGGTVVAGYRGLRRKKEGGSIVRSGYRLTGPQFR